MTDLKPTPNALPDEAAQVLARIEEHQAKCRRALAEMHDMIKATRLLAIGVSVLAGITEDKLNQAA